MKRQHSGSRSANAFGIVSCGLATLMFASCTSTVRTLSGKGREAAATYSAQEQQRSQPSAAVASAEPETVETRLTELFGFCQSGDMEMAAPYFVYRGPDKTREWKDTLRAEDPVEKGAAREICRRIKGYLDEGQSYSFGEVKVEREREGEWHALEVTFQQGDKTKKATFAFLLVKGQFSIGDID
jgi:hypothetical protein